jgi:sterol desaturase/sphingolipid hydroxylase (fatty acid hydroxylase superfamily)
LLPATTQNRIDPFSYLEVFETLIQQESAALIFTLLGGFVLVGLWETYAPRRQPSVSTLRRWGVNFALMGLNNLLLTVLVPATSLVVAQYCQAHGFGLLNALPVPQWLAISASVVVLDFVYYALHWVFHRVPWLWVFHRVHHADPDYDLTTGLRFHPGEFLVYTMLKLAAIAVLGIPPEVAFVMDLLLALDGFLVHGNVRINADIDRLLRRLVVTPEMHRVHHSRDLREGNSNYGAILSLWDRVLGTYVQEPRLGHLAMEFGVEGVDAKTGMKLGAMLLAPFARRPGVGSRN